jgi:hypothetical protein
MGVEGPKGGKEGDIKCVLFEEVNLIFLISQGLIN